MKLLSGNQILEIMTTRGENAYGILTISRSQAEDMDCLQSLEKTEFVRKVVDEYGKGSLCRLERQTI